MFQDLAPSRLLRPQREATLTVMTLFLCGDLMTGRGIDQILCHASAPELGEAWVSDARDYVTMAESVSGPIPRQVAPAYIWGDALTELARVAPDVRIVNLETSVTRCGRRWAGKGIHYRMHPQNVDCLTAAHIDVCVLANNHVLDYGHAGLIETLETLGNAGLKTAGAGRDLAQAEEAAIIPVPPASRVVVLAVADESSGVFPSWAAAADRPGVALLRDLSACAADAVLERVRRVRQPQDHVIVSIHWGSNWGYDIPAEQVQFAHRLIDGGVDVVHGHSSHHARPIEVYRNRLILYGCGDLIHDYEGIGGYEEYRNDLVLMYFAIVHDGGELSALTMTPLRLRKFSLARACAPEARWLQQTVGRACARFGSRVEAQPDGTLSLRWT